MLRIKAAVEKHFAFLEKNSAKMSLTGCVATLRPLIWRVVRELHAGKTVAKSSDFLLIASAATPHLILLMDGQLQSCNVMQPSDARGDNF